MEASQTVLDRSSQKETLIISRAEIDHVKNALKGLHIVSWFPRAYPENDRTSPFCAIPIVYPPHSEEVRAGDTRRIKVQKGVLCIKPVSPNEAATWVWGETPHHAMLGRPPAQ